MASGVINGTTNNKYIFTRIEWSSVADRINNRSTITAVFSAQKSSSSSEGTTGQGTWYLNIGGISKSFEKTMDLPNDNSWHEIGRNTVTIDHNSDGTKSIQILGSGGTKRTTWTSTNCSGVALLDPIPRETYPSFDAETKEFGSNLTITIDPAESTFTHEIFAQWQGDIAQISTGYSSGTIVYPISSQWMTDIPSAVTASMYVIVNTYEGARLVGTTTSMIVLNVPENVVPTISSIVLSDTGGIVPSSWGIFVKGKSTLHVKANASGAYGSEITTYQIEALDQTRSANDIDIGSIDSTYLSVKVTVYDTRGRTTTETVSHDVVDYSAPVISDVMIERANDRGIPVDNGTFLKLTLSASVASIDDHNTIAVAIYHQRSDAEERTLARMDYPTHLYLHDQVYMIPNMEASRSYEITVEIIDFFEEPTTQTGILPAEGGLISWKNGGTGVAFGKAAEEDYRADFGWRIHAREGADFDVPLPVESGGTGANNGLEAVDNIGAAYREHKHTMEDFDVSTVVNVVFPVGAIYITTNGVNPSTYFVGTQWRQVKDRFLLAAGDTYEGDETGGAESYALNVSHKHVAPNGYNSSNMYIITMNGSTTGGAGYRYQRESFDTESTLSSDVTMPYTATTTIRDTIPTMPPYLAVYVWIRTQ